MMSNVCTFYNKKRNGSCQYIYNRGPYMHTKCGETTSDVYCDDHEKEEVTYEKAVIFIQKLADNPEFLDRLMKAGLFFVKNHHYEDCSESDGCENCYDDDFDMKEELKDSLVAVLTSHAIPCPKLPTVPLSNNEVLPMLPASPLKDDDKYRLPVIPNTIPVIPTVSDKTCSENETNDIKVEVFDDGKYRDIATGFIIDDYFNLLGVSDDRKTIRLPSENEIQKADKIGLNVISVWSRILNNRK